MKKGNAKSGYRPPYTVSGRAMGMIAEIAAAVERYRILLEGPDGLRLRRINHIRTIRGTTAIEGNTLTEDQITAVLAGRRVAAPAREIQEVKGAHAAYDRISRFDPYSIDDLLLAHGLLTEGLVDRPGKFRTCNVGVMDGSGNVVHMAPPYGNVPSLVADLFAWLRDSEDPVLVKSCVFHYEFEFIHPFPDGNGRTGRLWQTALLGSWREEFYGAPVENIVWSHQSEYYEAINASTAKADSGPFIDFMLDKILRTLKAKGEAYAAGSVVLGADLKTDLKPT
ncbi:MAG: Fic family protein [Kiritimatiellae bacterium]|nr:Fic family protein [Kiritimatiellia bacterium]